MANFSLRYFHQAIVIPVIGLATIGTSLVSHFVNHYWGIALSAFALAALLFTAIDSWLWYYWPIKFLYQLKDFRGSYTGSITYERRDETGQIITGQLKHKKILSQTGSGVTIRSITYKDDGTISSESISKVESIVLEKDHSFKLIYSFLNNGSIHQGFPPHYGTEILTFHEEDGTKYLKGEYYTNRQPVQTRGEVDVIFENKKI